MTIKPHFSGKVLAAAAKLKDTIDLKFEQVIAASLRSINKTLHDPTLLHWKNAETFAREFKVNRKELQSAFKHHNGNKRINEYLTGKKIEAGCILLNNCELTIKEIAVELNYNQDYFSYIFKKQKGMTPSQWQHKEWERIIALKNELP
jgi:AraC-like DNA-binding protein